MTDLFERCARYLGIACAAAATLSVLLLIIVTIFAVFRRYVLGTPVVWTDEIAGYLVVAIAILGSAETLRTNGHIQIDLFTTSLKGPLRKVLQMTSMSLVVALMAALLASAWHTVIFSREFGLYSSGYLQTPMWMPQSLLVIGALSVVLIAVGNVARLLRSFVADMQK